MPKHLETVVPLVWQNPEVALGFSLVRTFGSQDRVWERDLPAHEVTDAFWPSVARCVAQTSSVVVRRDMVLAIGAYAEDLHHCQDYDLYMRLSKRHPFLCTHEITVKYRRHGESNSHQLVRSRWDEYVARERFVSAAQAEYADDPEFLRQLSAAMSAAYEQRFREAWGQRDIFMFDFLPQLSQSIPEGQAVVDRWLPRRKLIPLARAWDHVPEPLKARLRRASRLVRR